MNWHRIRAIIVKDLRNLKGNSMALVPIIIVPVVFCIILPVGLFLLASLGLENLIQGAEMVKKVIPLYDIPDAIQDDAMQMLYIFLNYSFLPLFMLVPVMTASILSADSVVGEKERQTLETLLYSPVTNKEFLTAKLLGSFIPGIVLGYIGFAGFFLLTNLASQLIAGIQIVGASVWWPAMLALNPAVALLALTITLMVSLKAKTFMEAQQTAGVVVLPFMILLVTQITGFVVFNPLMIIIFAAVLILIAGFLLYRIAPRFTREEIVSRL